MTRENQDDCLDGDEIAVGITTFINSDGTSFRGVIKHRYSDFLVNEIDPDGNVVHLKNLSETIVDDDKEENNNDSLVEEVMPVLTEAGEMLMTDLEMLYKGDSDGKPVTTEVN